MANVLVVDDEEPVRFTLTEILEDAGHRVVACPSAEAALEHLENVDVVLTDLSMGGRSGIDLLKIVRERDAELPVILLTARGSERVAIEAMRAGAFEYLRKPSDPEELALTVARAAEVRSLRQRNRQLRIEQSIGTSLIGESSAFRKVVQAAERVAPRAVPVLVRGESGTGKELLATLLHALSPRAKQPLVRFNCAAIPSELAEAELFGHVRGAFTGAHAARQGFFTAANHGTIVLDEVGELPLALQPKLLRVLQDGEVQPVGASKTERVDVRVLACTHKDLRAESDAGRFRKDLFYRLAVVELVLPSLAERKEDLPALIEEFRSRYARRFDLPMVRFSPALVDALCKRSWPGNVRELENAVARLLALSTTEEVGVEALTWLEPAASASVSERVQGSFRERVSAFEKSLLEETMRDCQGNQSEAARRLGLTRVTLLDKLAKHGLRKAKG